MQMRRNYNSSDREQRIRQLRLAGAELRRAGFVDSAGQNFELADWLEADIEAEKEKAEKKARMKAQA